MEKFKDVFNNLKDRFTNPLIFSFVCSWIIINWEITVALIWYDIKQIERTGCDSIFCFIRYNINISDCLWHPLLFAIAYTLLIPFIKNLIKALYSWTTKWGEDWNIKISKDGKIPVEKYLKLRENYLVKIKTIEDIISSENKTLEEYNELNNELQKMKAREIELQQKNNTNESFISNLYNVNILNGFWTNTFKDNIPNSKLDGSEEIEISNGAYFIIGNFNKKIQVFRIIHFYYDNKNKTMFFIKERINQEKAIENNDLKFNVNVLRLENDTLIGHENGTISIQYKRKQENILN